MKTLISVFIFASTMIGLIGFMSFMTDGFSSFELDSLAEKATNVLDTCKRWFR